MNAPEPTDEPNADQSGPKEPGIILLIFASEIYKLANAEGGNFIEAGGKTERALNAYYLSKALEIVGEDEIDPNAKTVWRNGIVLVRNKFRAELRKAFNQEWGQGWVA